MHQWCTGGAPLVQVPLAMEGEAERCIAADMDDELPKPLAVPDLAETLQKWLPG